MPRTIGFDRRAVLQAAMKTFWRYGYADTSLRMLAQATGLTTGSLYNSFGDKEQIFALCLNHFLENVLEQRILNHLEADNPLEGLLRYLRLVVGSSGEKGLRGCFLLNAHYPAEQLSPLVRDLVAKGQRRVDAAVTRAVSRATEAGQIDPRIEPEERARQINLMVSGVMARSRLDASAATREAAIRALEAILR